MGTAHAQVVLPHRSGMPSDVIVNTWNFTASATVDAAFATSIATQLAKFYNVTPAGQANPVQWYLSEVIDPATNAAKIKMYDTTSVLSGGNMGSPLVTSSFTLTGQVASTPLPSEVACCLTMEGSGRGTAAVEVAGPKPRQRPKQRHTGRVYLGPLNANAIYPGIAGEEANPHPTMKAVVLAALAELRDNLAGVSASLKVGVWSRANGTIYPLEAAYVDDRFDTIRSRGQRATSRTRVTL